MFLKYFYDDALAQASYMVGCQKTGEAAVIDPSRNLKPYFDTAEKEELTITKVFETHIHADYVSGSKEMAERAMATIYYSAENGGDEFGTYEWSDDLDTVGLKDGEKVQMGKVTLEGLHTPGHTPEHMSFILTDGAASDEPIGMFTGDFLFVGDVGRPDLLEKSVGVADSAKKGAIQMFHSLQRIKNYDPSLQIWPGHGAGSACGKSLGSIPTSTLGYEIKTNPALQPENEADFSDFLLADQPTPPAYFGIMKKVNKTGAELLAEQTTPLRFGANVKKMQNLLGADVTIVDTRSREAFAASHIPGTVNIPFDSQFANWMGSLISYDRAVYFITEEHHVDDLRLAMNAIGLDRTAGYFTPLVVEQYEMAEGTADYPIISPEQAEKQLNDGDLRILDIRDHFEYETSHVKGAENLVMNDIPNRDQSELPDGPVAVYCGSGQRSAIAASLLKEKGVDVRNIKGGFMRWNQESRPVDKVEKVTG
ncbi:MBL fold metallo-hydrolase [Salisediminibacterium beveridgei]|uniref:Zn-dependent hydroxyacylglutathione hydrolase / Polysulfide binding protein n=1 Tax=Salisediminibacterium beveridgei TaxID=632773 RepID=A0A1D7QYC0_9BACI|nr:MBL fold metallo-hydrolase [Salisediminibacterium beveridgei]AOM84004.1 Zn-dependent hydroxyacylglutathione hydrolase / Polysulfide binding protein [Salisediminibacterium beveridgei]